MPGGITSEPSGADLRQCKMLLTGFRRWYETYILGCSVERWQQVKSPAQLDGWLEEKSHFESDLGFLIRCGREFGLDDMGRGHESFLAVPEHGLPGISSRRNRSARLTISSLPHKETSSGNSSKLASKT